MSADLVTIDTPHGRFQSFRDDLISKQLVEFGGHQRPDLAAIRSFVRARDVVLDVGANIGTFAVPFARSVGPDGRVFGFEPMAETAAVLRSNIEANDLGDRISVVEALVSDVPGNFVYETLEHNVAATRFVPAPDDGGTPTAGAPVDAPPTVTIDGWAEQVLGTTGRVDLIKIDVEGMDIPVLRSARAVLERCLPVVSIEVAEYELDARGERMTDIDEILEPLGYHLFRNLGPRNAASDDFELGRLRTVADGGAFYDLIAVHRDSARYPADVATEEAMEAWRAQLRRDLAARRRPRRTKLRRAAGRFRRMLPG